MTKAITYFKGDRQYSSILKTLKTTENPKTAENHRKLEPLERDHALTRGYAGYARAPKAGDALSQWRRTLSAGERLNRLNRPPEFVGRQLMSHGPIAQQHWWAWVDPCTKRVTRHLLTDDLGCKLSRNERKGKLSFGQVHLAKCIIMQYAELPEVHESWSGGCN